MAGYVQLSRAECCDPEDGKKRINAGKVPRKTKKKRTKDEDVCSKLRRCSVS